MELALIQFWNMEDLTRFAAELNVDYVSVPGRLKMHRVHALIETCNASGAGYELVQTFLRWLNNTDPDLFEGLKRRVAHLGSLDKKALEHEFRLRDDFHFDCETEYEVNADGESQSSQHALLPLAKRLSCRASDICLRCLLNSMNYIGMGAVC